MLRPRVVVVDGTHQAWLCLKAFQQRDHTAAEPRAGRCIWAVRLWSADHRSTRTRTARPFGALGGTASPHRPIPSVAPHRQQQQTTAQQDPNRQLDNADGGLDALICHDAPESTSGLTGAPPPQMPQHLQAEADTVQALTRAATNATEPELVFHPHWHQQNRCRLNTGSEVVALTADGHPNSAAVLSIRSLRTRYSEPTQRSQHQQ